MIQNITSISAKTNESQYFTKPISVCDKLEHYLSYVFEKELKTEDSVLLGYQPLVIKKIAGYLSGKIKMPASIGIAGEKLGGKLKSSAKFQQVKEGVSDAYHNAKEKVSDGIQYTITITGIPQDTYQMRIEFKKDILNDEMIYKSIKDSKTINRYSNIFIAGNIIAGIDLRNLQRSNNNLDGEIEEYPYNRKQIEIIDKFMELNSLQEKIEEYVEVSQKEFEI